MILDRTEGGTRSRILSAKEGGQLGPTILVTLNWHSDPFEDGSNILNV